MLSKSSLSIALGGVMVGLLLAPAMPGAAAASDESGPPAQLRLLAEIDGRTTHDISAEGNYLIVRFDGRPVKLDRRVRWKLEGDLARHTDKVFFSPPYSLFRVPPGEAVGNRSWRRLKATFYISKKSVVWSAGRPGNPVLVHVWVKDGIITQVKPVALRSAPEASKPYTELYLSESEAPGAPVLLILRSDGWDTPPRWLSTDEGQELLVATHFGGLETVNDVLSRLQNVRERGVRAVTLLHLTAATGHEPAVRSLLQMGAPLADHDEYGGSALDWAVRAGRAGTTAALLEHARKNSYALNVGAVLQAALDQGFPEIALMILKGESDWHKRTRRIETIAEQAARYGRSDVLRELLAEGCAESVRQVGTAGLVEAVTADAAQAVAVLLETGIDPNASHRGTTPLATAVRLNRREVAELLLRSGAHPDGPERSSPAPLQVALEQDNLPILRMLLDAGADVQLRDDTGHSPVERALKLRSRTMMELFAAHGARLEVKAAGFPTALLRALEQDQVVLLTRAVEDGWNPQELINGRWPALFLAEHWAAAEVAGWLRSRGCDAVAANFSEIETLDVRPTALASPMPPEIRFLPTADLQAGAKAVAIIDESGSLLLPRIVHSPNEKLSQLLLESMPSWRFEPPLRAGKPTAVRLAFVVRCEVEAGTRAVRAMVEIDDAG